MASRRDRVERLLGLRERALETARVALASATRSAREASMAAAEAESAWSALATICAGAPFGTIDALVDAHAHVAALRRRADAARARAVAACAAEDTARAGCVRAERERRKLEIWRDRLDEIARAAESRKERLATDEMAARTFVRKHA